MTIPLAAPQALGPGRWLALPALALSAWLLRDDLAGLEARELGGAVLGLGAGPWALALALSALSFLAIGRAEAALHARLGTGVAPARAARAGRRAVAVSQAVGLGPASAGLVRWRCLPEMGLAAVAALSGLATLLSLLGLGLLAGAAQAGWPALALIALAPVALRGGRAGGLLGWTLLDHLAAALALAALLPGADPVAALPAVLLALGAGLLSQSPGGLGVLEATLLALLPALPPAEVLAGALAWRLCYHALPALLATAALARPAPPPSALAPVAPGALDAALLRAPQAEWGLARQGAELALDPDGSEGWMVRRAGAALAAIGRPLGAASPAAFAALARDRGLSPLLYKCDGRAARRARASGWRVLRLGDEAVLDLRGWSPEAPACRRLRRKLRAASASGVAVAMADAPPLDAMAALSARWAEAHGGERGFSMGRFDPGPLGRQAVALAWAEGRLVAFASFHRAPREWTLDLLRHESDAPDGALHAAIALAARQAQGAGALRLSLAGVPWGARRVAAGLVPAIGAGAERDGLGQFKRAFGPRLVPRFAAAPSWPRLLLGLLCVAWAVRRPAAPRAPIAPGRGPCHAPGGPPPPGAVAEAPP